MKVRHHNGDNCHRVRLWKSDGGRLLGEQRPSLVVETVHIEQERPTDELSNPL